MKTNVKDGIIHVERHSLNKRVRAVWVLASLLMIIGGALGLVFIQKPISQPQVIEKQASVDNGQVIISSEPQGSFLAAEQSEIYLNINTNGVQTDGLELTFSVVSDVIDQLEVQLLPIGLESTRLEIDATSTGFLVNVETAAPTDNPFSTTSATRVIKLSFTPTEAGPITLNFDANQSHAPVSNSDPVQDELKHIASMDFQIETNNTGAPEVNINYPRENQHIVFDSSTQEFCLVDVPTRGNFDGLQKRHKINNQDWSEYKNNYTLCFEPRQGDNTVELQYRNSQSEVSIVYVRHFNFERIGSGGNIVKQCNDLCSSNADCPVNHSCYQTENDGRRCRRADNTSSTSCAYLEDDGLNFSCNHYCADSTECSDEFTCLENRCKNPDNPDDEFCLAPTTQIISSNQDLCNQTCSSNSDCAINLTCYYGNCRLKSNPSSTSCTSVRKRIVYKTIYRTATGEIIDGKGGDLSMQASDSAKTATTSAQTQDESVEEKEIEIPYQADIKEEEDLSRAESREEETALDSLLNNLRDRGFSLSLLMILGGAALIIIVIISSLLGRRKNSTPKFETAVKQPLTPQTKEQMSSLEDRIQSLQQTPQPSSVQAPPPSRPVAPTPTPTQTAPQQPSTPVSMAQRAKDKGLVNPTSGKTEVFSNKS